MNETRNWLRTEIAAWEAEQLITPAQAEQLRQRYPAIAHRSWARIIFSVIGASIFGVGVILFFAYNWSAMPKFLKLGIVIGSVLSTHSLALFWRRRESAAGHSHNVSEGLHALGTIVFGAGIWLVAQIYHMDEHYPNALLLWGLGALSLAWAIPSLSQGIIAALLLGLWSSIEVVEFRSDNWLGAALFVCAMIPLAWHLRSRALLFIVLCLSMLQLVFLVVAFDYYAAFYLLLMLASLMIALSWIIHDGQFPGGAPLIRFVATAVYLLLLGILSFDLSPPSIVTGGWAVRQEFWNKLWFQHATLAVSFTVCCGAWIVVFLRARQRAKQGQSFERIDAADCALVVLTTLLLPLVHLQLVSQWRFAWALLLAFNLILIAHALLLIAKGLQRVSLRLLITGGALLLLVLSIRFTDLFHSLLLRSAFFLLLGAAMFWVGNFYTANKERRQRGSTRHA